MKIKLSLLLTVLLLLIGCSNDNGEPQVQDSGSLKVNVVHSDNSAAEGVLITLTPGNITVTTDENGIALFKDLQAGTYGISLSVNGITYSTDSATIENNTTTSLELTLLDEPNPIQPIKLDLGWLLESIYGKLKSDYLFDAQGYVSYWGDIGSDVAYVNDMMEPRLYEIDSYRTTPSNFFVEKVWEEHYKLIRDVHTGLDAIERDDFQADDNLDIDVVHAELRFIRALLYFNLVKIYGNPILVTSLVDPSGPIPNEQDPNKTYELIESDLLFAIDNLQSSMPINKASVDAARGVLGKVYLTMAGFPIFKSDGYAKALEQLKQVEGQYSLEANYFDVFSQENESNNGEVIFSIGFEDDGNYGAIWGPQGISFRDELFLAPNYPQSYFENPDEIFNPITFPLSTEDQRFFQNIATFTFQNGTAINDSDVSEWRPYKYKKEVLSPSSLDTESFDFPYLRYADVLLMIAEAENAINGPTAYAYDAINQVRRRAYGNTDHDIELGLNQHDFMEAILNERRLELAFEGTRKDDLVRTQLLQSVIDSFNENFSPNFKKDFQDFEYIWPIPQQEINLNPGATQNPGY